MPRSSVQIQPRTFDETNGVRFMLASSKPNNTPKKQNEITVKIIATELVFFCPQESPEGAAESGGRLSSSASVLIGGTWAGELEWKALAKHLAVNIRIFFFQYGVEKKLLLPPQIQTYVGDPSTEKPASVSLLFYRSHFDGLKVHLW